MCKDFIAVCGNGQGMGLFGSNKIIKQFKFPRKEAIDLDLERLDKLIADLYPAMEKDLLDLASCPATPMSAP